MYELGAWIGLTIGAVLTAAMSDKDWAKAGERSGCYASALICVWLIRNFQIVSR